MGDARYAQPYERVRDAPDRAKALKALTDVEVVEALAHASREADPLLANVLATEASNRIHRATVIQEHVADGLVSIDAEGHITNINRAASALLGWPPEALLGQDKHSHVHNKDERGRPIPRDECRMLHILETGETIEYERDVFTRRDGSTFPVSYTAAPITADGKVEGVVVAFRDITERKRMDDDRVNWLNLVDAFYHVHDELGIGMVIVDNGHVFYANDALRDLLGYTLDEIHGLDIFSLVAEEERQAFQAHLGGLFIHGTKDRPRRVRLQRKGGGTVEVEMLVAKVNHQPRGISRLVCVVRQLSGPAEEQGKRRP